MKTMILICNFEKLGYHFLRVKPITIPISRYQQCIQYKDCKFRILYSDCLFQCFFIYLHGFNGQSQMKPNTLYFQLGGNGLFTSINYERQIIKHPTVMIHGGIGHYGINTPFVTLIPEIAIF